MRQETLDKLHNDLQQYKIYNYGIKYRFQNNNVNIRIFYDEKFDDKQLFLILFCDNNNYYFTSLNCIQVNEKEYLKNLPFDILNKIKNEENNLDDFFNSVNEHILNRDPERLDYTTDEDYGNILNQNNNDNDLKMFFWHLRKKPMSKDYFDRLKKFTNYDVEDLKLIRKLGYTIVSTNDINKAKNFKLALQELKENN